MMIEARARLCSINLRTPDAHDPEKAAQLGTAARGSITYILSTCFPMPSTRSGKTFSKNQARIRSALRLIYALYTKSSQ